MGLKNQKGTSVSYQIIEYLLPKLLLDYLPRYKIEQTRVERDREIFKYMLRLSSYDYQIRERKASTPVVV